MHFSSAILALATVASGVTAHPGLHHRHNRIHERRHLEAREPLTFFMDKKPAESNGSGSGSAGNDSASSDDKTDGSKPAAGGASNSGSSSSSNSNAKPGGGGGTGARKSFCGGPSTNMKRATAEEIAYKGNTGSPGHWGCNIMEVDCGDLHLYDYGTIFEGNSGGAHDVYSCSAFNKIGPTGGIDPGWHSALDFQVPKGAQKCLAFDKNSQGSIACNQGTGGPLRTTFGQMASTWYEFDFGSDKNDHQSGSDVSVLVANSNKLPYIGMAIDAPGKGTCSWLKESGENFQAYMGGMEALDGVGCTGYSTGQVKVTLGY